ncbi:hypothetical protein ACOME3_006280 [Neoechinorhynchus agilis]
MTNDAFFTNYNWNSSCINCCLNHCDLTPQRVFMGVDVFGRGASPNNFCKLGLGYGAASLVSMASSSRLSCALFAPGWVMECNDEKDFLMNQSLFISQLNEAIDVKSSTIFDEDYFCTSFSSGRGRMFCVNGVPLANTKNGFSCLSLATFIPVTDAYVVAICDEEKAYYGGSSLKIVDFSTSSGGFVCAIVNGIKFAIKSQLEYEVLIAYDGNYEVDFALNYCENIPGNFGGS